MHLSIRAPLIVAAALWATTLWAGSVIAAPEKVWEATGLKNPESALYDASSGTIYVSDIAWEGDEKDGIGFIAKLSPDGTVVDAQWVGGLDSPKGLALFDGKLYVADIDKLVVIDVAKAAVIATHQAPDAKFLNDVTIAADGRVFVSDMVTDTIWKLEGGTFEAWLQDSALDNPNGLLAVDGKILVAARGTKPAGAEDPAKSNVKVVDIATMQVSDLGDPAPIGNLDGIIADGRGGYIVSDWRAGALFSVTPDGKAELLVDLDQSSADIGFIEEERIVLVPMMMKGSVEAYRLD